MQNRDPVATRLQAGNAAAGDDHAAAALDISGEAASDLREVDHPGPG